MLGGMARGFPPEGVDFMECGGNRSATPLWLERLVLRWIRHKHQPKRRRASLAAALHMAVADTFNRILHSAALLLRLGDHHKLAILYFNLLQAVQCRGGA